MISMVPLGGRVGKESADGSEGLDMGKLACWSAGAQVHKPLTLKVHGEPMLILRSSAVVIWALTLGN